MRYALRQYQMFSKKHLEHRFYSHHTDWLDAISQNSYFFFDFIFAFIYVFINNNLKLCFLWFYTLCNYELLKSFLNLFQIRVFLSVSKKKVPKTLQDNPEN